MNFISSPSWNGTTSSTSNRSTATGHAPYTCIPHRPTSSSSKSHPNQIVVECTRAAPVGGECTALSPCFSVSNHSKCGNHGALTVEFALLCRVVGAFRMFGVRVGLTLGVRDGRLCTSDTVTAPQLARSNQRDLIPNSPSHFPTSSYSCMALSHRNALARVLGPGDAPSSSSSRNCWRDEKITTKSITVMSRVNQLISLLAFDSLVSSRNLTFTSTTGVRCMQARSANSSMQPLLARRGRGSGGDQTTGYRLGHNI